MVILSSPCCLPVKNLVLGGTLPVGRRIPTPGSAALYQNEFHTVLRRPPLTEKKIINMKHKQILLCRQTQEIDAWINGLICVGVKLTLKYLSFSDWSLSNV